MAAEKNVLGFIDPGRKIRRPPLVGMQFLHQRAVGTPDLLGGRSRLHATRRALRRITRCP